MEVDLDLGMMKLYENRMENECYSESKVKVKRKAPETENGKQEPLIIATVNIIITLIIRYNYTLGVPELTNRPALSGQLGH